MYLPINRFKIKILPFLFQPVFLFVLISCSPSPQPIPYGKVECTHCSMKVMDQRFGCEIVSRKGKVMIFDAIECMTPWYNKNDRNDFAFVMVSDAAHPGVLIPAEKAFFLKSENLPSPMGGNLSAFRWEADRDRFIREHTGEKLSWQQVLALYKE